MKMIILPELVDPPPATSGISSSNIARHIGYNYKSMNNIIGIVIPDQKVSNKTRLRIKGHS